MPWKKGKDKYGEEDKYFIQHTDGSVISKYSDGEWYYQLYMPYSNEPIGPFKNGNDAKSEYRRLTENE